MTCSTPSPKLRRSDALTRMIGAAQTAFAAPPTLTVSEWADRERILSPEASAEAGRWDTSRAEYLRGVMDALSDASISRVVVAKASQVGYTECLGNIVGYFIDQDPCSMLIVQPTVEMGEAWSKDRLAPMLRDCPALAGKVSSPQARDASNTLRQKVFHGGRLAIVGANSPAGLASRPVRVVLADEVDRYPVSAGSEGDPLSLAARRQSTYWNRKTLVGSTPTLKGSSVIWREWLASDQRKFHVPCPDCDHEQVLSWSNVRWDKAPSGKHLPHTAHYVCEHCGSIWTDADRHDAVARGRWQATNADGAPGLAGFHISALMSPWVQLSEVVAEFLAARKDAALLQVWTNTVLGEPFEEEREVIEATSLMTRGENYGPQSIPEPVKFLTAGVDTQGDRLEVQIVGWGPFEEAWAVRYAVLPGDPAQQHVWDQLDDVLRAAYCREDGREMRVRLACVDAGGHHQHQVLEYCRRRKGVVAIRGAAGAKPIWSGRASKTRHGHRVYWTGVDTAKDTIYSRLRFAEPGPGYMHFPTGGLFTEEYYRQLTSEEVQTRYNEGRPYRIWMLPGGRRNEVLDTWVYALAARTALPYRLDVAPPRPRPPAPRPPAALTAEEFVALAEKVPPAPSLPQYRTGVRRGRVIVRSSFVTR